MLDSTTKSVRCAIYTRKSSDEGLEQEFNSLDAQRESCEAYIRSQQQEGWIALPALYDDGGFSGGSMERPALRQLLEDVKAGAVNTIVVYKIDRLTRSLMDFAKIVEVLDSHGASFVSVTQQFNTTTSMGRLTLNVLLSFAQFEREVTAERIRDKIAQSKAKGMWTGGCVPLGYEAVEKKLVVNPAEATTVKLIFERYLELGCVQKLQADLEERGLKTKQREHKTGRKTGGSAFSRSALYQILKNRIYIGEIAHRGNVYAAQHQALVPRKLWDQTQDALAASAVEKKFETSAEVPALLAGIIFDDKGHRMTSTHSNKKGVRYRYYTSQTVLQNRKTQSGFVTRVPAQPLEDAVLDEIRRILGEPTGLVDIFGADTDKAANLVSHAPHRLRELNSARPSELRTLCSTILKRLDVGANEVTVTLNAAAMRGWLVGSPSPIQAGASAVVVRRIPLQLRKTARGTKLILGPNLARPQINEPLVNAVVRANGWLREMLNGQIGSIQEIADRERLKQRYTARILRLAFLSPEITEAVLDGRQPGTLELKDLMDLFPTAWNDQARAFLRTM